MNKKDKFTSLVDKIDKYKKQGYYTMAEISEILNISSKNSSPSMPEKIRCFDYISINPNKSLYRPKATCVGTRYEPIWLDYISKFGEPKESTSSAKPEALSAPTPKEAKARPKAEALQEDSNNQYLEARNNYLNKVKPGIVWFSTNPAHRKILSLSDLHMPFHDQEAIDMALDYDGNADVLVINGDILDCYCVSSYAKDRGIPLSTEYNLALNFIREMSSKFEEVHLVKGNHENRVDRYLSQRIDPYSSILGNRDILHKLSKGMILDENGMTGRSYDFKNVYYNELGLPWMAKVGKTIFMHPDTYLSQPGATVVRGVEHIRGQIPWDSFDSLVMGHTHKQAKLIEHNKVLIEQGALCLTMGYQKQAEFKKRPSITGYAVIYQDKEGNIRPDLSNFNYLKTINIFE